jgi:hypothetical protein
MGWRGTVSSEAGAPRGRRRGTVPWAPDGLTMTSARVASLWGASVLVLAAVAALAAAVDQPVAFLTREPQVAVLDGECSTRCTYAGLLSNLGVLIFAAGAAICFLAAYLLSRNDRLWRSPLLWGGLVLTMLLVDDMFALHDFLFPPLLPQGELLSEAAYALAGLAYVVVFRDVLLRHAWTLLPLGAAFFIVAALLDRAWEGHHLFEDGSKFLGIVTLTAFFADMSVAHLRRRIEPG